MMELWAHTGNCCFLSHAAVVCMLAAGESCGREREKEAVVRELPDLAGKQQEAKPTNSVEAA